MMMTGTLTTVSFGSDARGFEELGGTTLISMPRGGKVINGVTLATFSKETGKALAFSIFNLQNRGKILISPGEKIFEGMIIGIHSRDNDLVVNPLKGKQLTNIRAVGSDENIQLIPPITFTLEQALEFIEEDELVDVTPHAIRVRKKILRETDRKKNRSSK